MNCDVKPSLSVIVPVYMVEEYLDKCIESIVEQSYQNLEIILVNDGSPDNCPIICEKWAEKDKRITVLHKNNGGLSDARNVGLKKAKGDYVWFIDSDDWITDDALDIIVEGIMKYPNNDVFSTYLIEYKDNIKSMYLNQRSPNDYKSFKWKEFVDSGDYLWPAQRHIIRRQFLIDNNISFIKGILHEDLPFTNMVFYCAKSVVLLPIPIYYYRIREGSIMGTLSFRTCNSLLEGYKACLVFMEQNVRSEDETWYRLLLFRMLKGLYYQMNNYCDLDICRIFYKKNRIFLNDQLNRVYKYVPFKEKIYIKAMSVSPRFYRNFCNLLKVKQFFLKCLNHNCPVKVDK